MFLRFFVTVCNIVIVVTDAVILTEECATSVSGSDVGRFAIMLQL